APSRPRHQPGRRTRAASPHKMHCGSDPRTPRLAPGGPSLMPKPQTIWASLAPAVKQQVIDDIATICTEVIHERIRIYHSLSSQSPGHHLHSPVQPPPDAHQPGEPETPVRPPPTRPGIRLEARCH